MILFMRLALLTVTLLFPITATSAELGPMPREVRFDRFGDPLPEGAIARLGTTRGRHPGAKHLTFSADGSRFITWGDDRQVCVWSTATGERRHIWSQTGAQWPITCATDDGRLIGVSTGGHFEVLNIEEKRLVRQLSFGDASQFSAAAFSRDGKQLATADYTPREHRIRVWDLATGKNRVLGTMDGKIEQLQFSPDGLTLYSCSEEEAALTAWECQGEKQCWRIKKDERLSMMALCDNGQQLYVSWLKTNKNGAVDRVLGMIETATGNVRQTKVKLDDRLFASAVSADGKRIAVARFVYRTVGKSQDLIRDRFVEIFDVEKNAFSQRIATWPSAMQFRRDGKALHVLEHEGLVQAYDLTSQKPVYADWNGFGHVHAISKLAWSPDQKMLLSADDPDGMVRLWDPLTGETKQQWSSPPFPQGFARNGQSLLCANGPTFLLRNLQSGKQTMLPKDRNTKQNSPWDVFVLSGGMRARVARVCRDGYAITTLDLTTGTEGPATTFKIKTDCANGIGVSVSAHHAICEQQIWHIATRERLDTINSPDVFLWSDTPKFSSDDRLIAVNVATTPLADEIEDELQHKVRIYDRLTGQALANDRVNEPERFEFSPDNRCLAVARGARTTIWRLAGTKENGEIDKIVLRNTSELSGSASALTFSPDVSKLAVGYDDTTILVWELPKHAAPQSTRVDRESLWSDLASSDAKKAWRAIWQLQDRPEQALVLLNERLKPAAAPTVEEMKQLLDGLDDKSFRQREVASKRLSDLGDLAKPGLLAALRANPSEDKKDRMAKLLASLDSRHPPRGDDLRTIRALAVLEYIKTDEAKQLVVKLSKGLESARSSREAKETCERLAIKP